MKYFMVLGTIADSTEEVDVDEIKELIEVHLAKVGLFGELVIEEIEQDI